MLKTHKAQEIGTKRGRLLVDDFLYLIRKVIYSKWSPEIGYGFVFYLYDYVLVIWFYAGFAKT